MRKSLTFSASPTVLRFAPWRTPFAATVVVLLLSALFAGTILAAMQSHPLVDATQAVVEGGL